MLIFRGGVNSEKREVADLIGSAVDGWLGHLNIQLEVADPQMMGSFTGTLSRWQNAGFSDGALPGPIPREQFSDTA